MHRVVVLALADVVTLDVAIPAQLFGYRDALPYEVVLAGARRGPVPTTAGFPVTAAAGPEALASADTVVVPGFAPHSVPPPPRVLRALTAAAERGARVMSICTGAFALAAAGLLDGRRATTHWMHAAELAAAHPAVDVDPAVLFVDSGPVLTSAGVAAGIDLCLHVIRTDHGAAAATAVARRVVVAPHREGGQAQYLHAPLPAESGSSLTGTRQWALEHLDRPLAVADLAAHAHVSTRTLARRWAAETGTTPLRWLLAQRLQRARLLLETCPDLLLADVAHRCGLGTADNLRLHLRRETGTSPSAYRRTFGEPGGAPLPR
ncbi:DJ-1/PfpI family protein [Kineococcus glutinatus]|uniref:DJ-1/PfpI family protein n=1 Tax=Kineococcus glutinatus TaxID=1070872 RepID=UPI0031E8E9CC